MKEYSISSINKIHKKYWKPIQDKEYIAKTTPTNMFMCNHISPSNKVGHIYSLITFAFNANICPEWESYFIRQVFFCLICYRKRWYIILCTEAFVNQGTGMELWINDSILSSSFICIFEKYGPTFYLIKR